MSENIIQIITLIITALNPLIIALAIFMKRVTNSECCGSKIEREIN